jgi:hypothetical protein
MATLFRTPENDDLNVNLSIDNNILNGLDGDDRLLACLT